MIGETYYERGEPVTVLVAWLGGRAREEIIAPRRPFVAPRLELTFSKIPAWRGGPRNVLIQRSDGSLVVRPFRGLRRTPNGSAPGGAGG